MLEMLGIPYVGSGPEGHALAIDKVITKIIMQNSGIPTPRFWVFSTGDEDMSEVQYPVIVKPKMEAVSYGLKIIDNEADLREAIICPANISQQLADEMIKLSKKAFNVLGLRDFARVDIRIDENENIYLLEINSMASLGRTGSYVHAAKVAGYDYTTLVNKILEVAAVRYFSESLYVQEVGTVSPRDKLLLPVRTRTFLRSKQQEIENLLAKMANINSHVRNVDGVNTLGTLIWKLLSPLGFALQAIPKVEVGNILFFSNTRESEYDILLLSHLDTAIPFKRQVNFHETEHKLYGTGIWDSKGGLTVMIAALRALRVSRLLRNMRIGILLTTDNTVQGKISRSSIQEMSSRAKAVIGLNGASLDGTVITSRSGAALYDCQMNLMNADKAVAVAEANADFTRLLTRLTQLSNESERLVVTLKDVTINSNVMTGFAHGETSVSVRFDNPGQGEIVDQKIRNLVKKAANGRVQYHISGGIRRNPLVRTSRIETLYQVVKMLGKQLDIRILEEHRWSTSDICFVDPRKPMIDGLGPVGETSQDDEEYILRHSLLDRAALLALLLNELCQKR